MVKPFVDLRTIKPRLEYLPTGSNFLVKLIYRLGLTACSLLCSITRSNDIAIFIGRRR